MSKATGAIVLLALVSVASISCSGGEVVKTCDVILQEIGPMKIEVVPVVHTFRADLDLKEANELVISAPVKVLEAVPCSKAAGAMRALEEVHAIAEIIQN
jgi:ribosomal protein L7/L12